jgi:phage/plasmid primase-like uncharacterized protein
MPSRIQISAFEAVHQFRNFLLSIGFDLNRHEIRMDGKWHNVRLEGQRGYAKSGGYVGYLDDFPQGLWHNHRTGDHGRWEPDGERVPIPPAEAERLERIRREREAARRLEKEQWHQARAEIAQRLWGRAGEAGPGSSVLAAQRHPAARHRANPRRSDRSPHRPGRSSHLVRTVHIPARRKTTPVRRSKDRLVAHAGGGEGRAGNRHSRRLLDSRQRA